MDRNEKSHCAFDLLRIIKKKIINRNYLEKGKSEGQMKILEIEEKKKKTRIISRRIAAENVGKHRAHYAKGIWRGTSTMSSSNFLAVSRGLFVLAKPAINEVERSSTARRSVEGFT